MAEVLRPPYEITSNRCGIPAVDTLDLIKPSGIQARDNIRA